MDPISETVQEFQATIDKARATRLQVEELARREYIARVRGTAATSPMKCWSCYEQLTDVPPDQWNSFDAYCPPLQKGKRQVFDFVRDPNRVGLVLAGDCGSGKSHLAKVIREQCGGILKCIMISEPDLVQYIQAGYSGQGETEDHIMARYQVAEGLILDDVGTAHVKAESRTWIEGIYWRLFDMRTTRKLRTVITTNLDLRGLGARLGQRAMSRMMGMMGDMGSYVDLFGVPDYRTRGWRQE